MAVSELVKVVDIIEELEQKISSKQNETSEIRQRLEQIEPDYQRYISLLHKAKDVQRDRSELQKTLALIIRFYETESGEKYEPANLFNQRD
ncbi:MAG: hypothetical protein Q8933_20050 [Bacteroidota bacterium]|nr:hypothetical protein [Bacteroidota bacterium]